MAEQKGIYQPWSHEEFMADRKVRRMSTTEAKTYMMLLHEAFICSTRPNLPDDEEELYLMAYCADRREWDSIKDAVLGMFDKIEVDGKIVLSSPYLRDLYEKECRGLVYFIQGEISKRIKIGQTDRDLRIRRSQLQVGSPEKLNILGHLHGGKFTELCTQMDWKENHSHGEWYNESPELLKFIQENACACTSS